MNILDELEQHIVSLERISVKKSQELYTQADGVFEGISWEGYNKTRRAIAASLSEVEMLKAQVNCLRKAALDAISYMTGGEAKANLRDAYDATPEQCLVEVKAKAIEGVADVMRQGASYTEDDDYYIDYLLRKANKIREQAK